MVVRTAAKAARNAAKTVTQKAGRREYPLGATTEKYPLSIQLSNLFPLDSRTITLIEKAPDHVDVVSPGLCDDILKYIGPSLEQYKGCDIIDVHPGACLWSQKLHEFLKPRRHLLMEPDEHYFEHFIKPLLESSPAYRHTTLSGAHPKHYWRVYDQIFNDDLLPKRTPLDPDDPARRQPNRSLLVTGALARRYKNVRSHTNNVHTANLILGQMTQASQTNSLFHTHGPVRMLFWMPEDTKNSVLPDTILGRFSYPVSLDSVADLVEVTGHDRFVTSAGRASQNNAKRSLFKHRFHELDLLGASRVLKNMQKQNISVPVHRRTALHQQAIEKDTPTDPVKVEDFAQIKTPMGNTLEEKLATYEKQFDVLYHKVTATKLRRREALGIPYDFNYTKTTKDVIVKSEQDRVGPLLDLWCAQVALEYELCATRSKLSEEAQKDIETRLLNCTSKMKEALKKLANERLIQIVSILTDEMYAMLREEPLLAWDRRPYEPLKAFEEEFWPRFGMYLVDVQPRLEHMGDDLMNASEANAAYHELLRAVFTAFAATVPQGVERAGPNAANDLLRAIPELKDASKGGRLSLDDLNVRMLTRQHLRKLAKAYIEWPFRPTAMEPAHQDPDEA